MEVSDDKIVSRFILKDDDRADRLVFEIPDTWWSRPYEYAWAAEFAGENDVVLDAACGIAHPFKFYLAEKCQKVFAADIDGNLSDRKFIISSIRKDVGEEAYKLICEKKEILLDTIHFSIASVEDIPFADKSFDKIFCISVLEHLPDANNKYWDRSSIYGKLKRLLSTKEGIKTSLKEFARVLKDDGRIILTFDYPDINLDYLDLIIDEAGLCYLAQKETRESDRLYSRDNKLSCYRAVLQKR